MSLPSEVTHPFNKNCSYCMSLISIEQEKENRAAAARRVVPEKKFSFSMLNDEPDVRKHVGLTEQFDDN